MPSTKPRIRDWPRDARPRDNLREKQTQYLTNAELLSMLIGPGNARCNSLELAQKVLAGSKDHLSELCKLSIPDLMQIPGIGKAKASAIFSFAELSRRRQAEQALELPHMNNTQAAAAYMTPLLCDFEKETFVVMFLNSANQLIDFEVLFEGGITAVYIDPRVIYKKALRHKAVAIITGQNLVSRPAKPRLQDETRTLGLQEAGEYLDIKLLDHILITDKEYFSFASEGFLN
jgi:DNA repair protein RadC